MSEEFTHANRLRGQWHGEIRPGGQRHGRAPGGEGIFGRAFLTGGGEHDDKSRHGSTNCQPD